MSSSLEIVTKLFNEFLTTATNEKNASTIKYINKLINDFSKLLNDQPFYDVEMTVGQDQEHTKTFRVHSTVLRARSPYFNVALSNEWIRRSKDGIIIFEKKNTTPKVFEIIIK